MTYYVNLKLIIWYFLDDYKGQPYTPVLNDETIGMLLHELFPLMNNNF